VAVLRYAVSGASGLIGSAVTGALASKGHRVHRIVRGGADPARGDIDLGAGAAALLEGCDGVVHLAGANIATRWTRAAKERILRSRTEGTCRLAETIARLEHPPSAFVCASGAGYYGDTGDTVADERSPKGAGFLADVVAAWEAAAEPAKGCGVRVASCRFGVVLSPHGGALRKMLPAFRFGLGGPIGNGRQWMSWVALDDAVRTIVAALERSDLEGPINVAAPEAVRNADFVATLAGVLRRPAVFPLPAAVVRLVLGEMGEATLLASSRVAPWRLTEAGFEFRHATLAAALRHELAKTVCISCPRWS